MIAALVGGALAVVVVAIAAAVAFGLTLDASRWRDAAAQRASAALGRPVMLAGALELTLGRELALRVGGVRILGPAGFSGAELLTVGEATVRLDLLDALRGQPRLRSVDASDVALWLERSADGRANWASPRPTDPAAAPPALDLGQITLRTGAIHYHDAGSSTRRSVALDELSASAAQNDPLRLALRGRVGEQTAFALKLEGGTLRLLQGGAEPWPFELDLESSGARLHANGMLDTRKGEARFAFDASADEVASVGAAIGATLPRLGVAALRGTVAATADAVALSELRGTLGESAFSGQIALALAGPRQRLSGTLSVATFDLRPFLATDPAAQPEPFDHDALLRQTLPLRDLLPIDIELDLSVGRSVGLPVDVRDVTIALQADRRGLRAPMAATVAGAALTGQLDLDTAAPTPTLALQFAARDVALGDLARELAAADGATGAGIEGKVGRFDLRLGGRGETLGALVRDLELSLALAATQVTVANAGRPIGFTLDTLALAAGRGERLRGTARGSLLGERAKLSLRAGTLPDMLRQRATPLELDLALAEATLRIETALALGGPARDATAVRFDFHARRAGDLARWLPVAPASDLPVALRGRGRVAEDAWTLAETTLRLGRSELTIDARRTRSGGRPITTATVRSPLLDLPELLTLRRKTNEISGANVTPGARIDAPIFPAALDLPDADLELALQQVFVGRADLADVSLIARTREGRLLPSSMTGRLAGAPFTALAEFDPRGDAPSARLDLSTGAIDVGSLLRGLGLAQDIDGRADALHLTLQGRGNTPREFALQAAVEARVVGGSLTVLGAAQRPVTEIRVSEATFGAAPGEPIRGRLDGAIDQTPVKLELSTGTFASFTGDATELPFALAAQAAGTRLSLDGEVTLPLGRAARLTFAMSGERLDTLNALTRVELPAWGPWSLRGPIRITPTGYELRGLLLDVGQSRLSGSGTLDISGPRPRLDVQVAAPSIQLDDFPPPQRLIDDPPPVRLSDDPPLPKLGDDAPTAAPEGLRVTASALAGRTDSLLSAAFLRRFDARIDVQAHEVLSGTDRLADGELHFALQDGRLALDPVVVNLPGGRMQLSLSYDLKGAEVDFAAAAQIERFDYGIIARRLGQADGLRGQFSLNFAVAGRAPSLDAVMKSANGSIDFAAWPTELSTGIFKRWSTNLLLTLLPLIDPDGESQVNCIVGRFDLDNGRLTSDKILIDMTAVRVRGEGRANLATEELAFVFRPRAKGLALFRLQTPLRVTGTLDDQHFGHERSEVVASIFRMLASPILLPIERFTLGPLPRDGADLCTDPLRASAR